MNVFQFSLARVSRQLRDDSKTRELSDDEAGLLAAIERDVERWEKIRNNHDKTQQNQNAGE
jgi:hypothetical protein